MSWFIDCTWGDINAGDVGPGMGSWFHILCLVLMVVFTTILAVTLGRKHSPVTDRKVIGGFAIALVIGEIFRQAFWYEFYQYYRFEILPYQFCDVPIYVSIVASLVRSEKVREVCYRFLAFFGIIGGIAVMAVPSAVLYTYFIPISIHSMVWHSILIAMGVYLIVSRGYGKKVKEMLAPFIMYLGMVGLALIGNVLVWHLHLNTPNCQPGDNLSMFYISPYYPTQLPVLGAIQEVSYPLFLVTYIAFFTGLSFLVWGVAKLCRTLGKKKA